MKTALLTLLISLTLLLTSCFTPINLEYDSARMMNSGAIEVQGNASAYALFGGGAGLLNTNLGGKLGFGVTKHYTLKLRYEQYFYPSFDDLADDLGFDFFSNSYVELENKIAFNDKGRFALSLPLGFYV